MRALFVLFIVLPLFEIFTLIQVGKVIGGFNTILVVIATAILGAALIRRQGLTALARARGKMSAGALPAEEMVEGLFLAIGGILLITPGFITDFVGFCCLLPGVRRGLVAWGMRHLAGSARFGFYQGSSTQPSVDEPNRTIEGEFKREK